MYKRVAWLIGVFRRGELVARCSGARETRLGASGREKQGHVVRRED